MPGPTGGRAARKQDGARRRRGIVNRDKCSGDLQLGNVIEAARISLCSPVGAELPRRTPEQGVVAMSRYSVIFMALAGVLAGTLQPGRSLHAQTRGLAVAELTLVLRIPGLFAVQDVPTGAPVVRAGGYARSERAVQIYVSGNAPWKLLAESGGVAGELAIRASAAASGAPFLGHGDADAVEAPAADAAFVRLDGGSAEVAHGLRGTRLPIAVDYRWRAAGAAPRVTYTVVAA
jgi:hypothetical protein